LRDIGCKTIQGPKVKKVFRATNRIDKCTIPEYTNEWVKG